MIDELTATLTATRSIISLSTKIITHDHPPDTDHRGPSQILRMDLRIKGIKIVKPGAILGARLHSRPRTTTDATENSLRF